LADADKIDLLLSDVSTIISGVTNAENVYTYLRGFESAEAAFREAFKESGNKRIQGWVVHRTNTGPSEVQEVCQRYVTHEITIDGFHSYDKDSSTQEDRFNTLCSQLISDLYKESSWSNRDFMEPDRWPEMEGPETVQIGPNKARMLHVRLRCFPTVGIAA